MPQSTPKSYQGASNSTATGAGYAVPTLSSSEIDQELTTNESLIVEFGEVLSMLINRLDPILVPPIPSQAKTTGGSDNPPRQSQVAQRLAGNNNELRRLLSVMHTLRNDLCV